MRDQWKSHLVGTGLILFLFAWLVLGSRPISITADEPSHIASGYAFLARGLDGLWTLSERGHPLLVDAWLALPIFIAQPDIPLESLPGWQTNYGMFVSSFLAYLEPLEQSKLMGRVPEMLLALLLAAVVYRWGMDLWGQRSGLLALGVLVFDPTLLAHSRLATNDVGVVALGTLTLYVAWRWWQQASWGRTTALGVLLAATMLAKQSGVLWVSAFGVGTLWLGLTRRRSCSFWSQALVAGTLAFLLFWAAYGFTFGEVSRLSMSLPAPAHWQGIFRHERRNISRHVFALGMREQGKWWWYFPLAFLIKNPLPFLLGIGISAGTFVRRPAPHHYILALGLFPVFYTAVAVAVGMNIGYRHILPIHPFLYLIIGGGLGQWGWGQRSLSRRKWIVGVLGAWYVAAAVQIFPYEIAYFNELVGGPEGGYRYLADSNLDWGQSAQIRDAYLDTHPEVQTEPPPTTFRPSPGRYLISASALQGLGISDPDAYEWFRHWTPSDVINYSLLLYDVLPFEMTWVAQCEKPRAPLDNASIFKGMGQDNLRTVQFDCTQAWLYPGGGAEPGIYALHHDLVGKPGLCLPSFLPCPTVPDDPFMARHLAQARLSFEQAHDSQLPAFVLYEVLPNTPSFNPMVYAAPNDIPPAMLEAFERSSTPVTLDGPLAFLNAVAYLNGDLLEVETWWSVTDAPISRPFSIMGQLVSSNGEILDGFDKLGVSPLALVTGDVVVQRHLFSRPPQEAKVWLRTGAYWLDTMERWAVAGVPQTNSLLVHLEVN